MHDESHEPSTNTPGLSRRETLSLGAGALAGLALAGVAGAQNNSTAPVAADPVNRRMLAGQVALVTGGARGIGQAIAVTLARHGANVAVLDVARHIEGASYPLASPADLAETARLIQAEGQRALTIQADIRDTEAMRAATERTIRELGPLDIVCANAGICSYPDSLAVTTDAELHNVIGVNLIGTANTLRAVIPHMQPRKTGRIIVTAASDGRHGAGGVSHYSASKWGLYGLMKGVAQELGPSGITVNAVTPTGVVTAMTSNEATYRWANRQNPSEENLEAALRAYNVLPVGRLQPQDVADAVLFLVSPGARFITGASIDVAAGANTKYTA